MQLEFHQLERRWEHLRVRHAGRQRRLLASLAEVGQQTPIVVVAAEGPADRYVVIDGYKRIAALEQLGRDTVEAVVWPMNEAAAVLLDRSLRLSEHETALEVGWLLQELERRFGYGLEELARRFDRSVSWVSRRLALVEVLPEAIQQQIHRWRMLAKDPSAGSSRLKALPNLFGGVELLTLSACNRGVGDTNGDGKEVEGLGVLAQRKGAKAVVASLWPVADASTSVSINRGCSGALLATIPVATAPLQADVTPDGTLAIVTSFNNAVNFIDLTTNSVAYTLQTTPDVNPSGVVISTDGSTAYVTSFTSTLFQGTPELLIINIAQRKIVGTLPVSDFPQSVFITPDGSQVWVTHPFSSTIEIIDTLTNTQSYGLLVQSSFDIVFDSTGTRAFIAGGASNVVVIDTASYATLATIPVGQSPEELVLTPEDGMLIVSNYAGRSVTLVDASGYTVLGTFSLPGKMRGLALIQ